jgi:hypothetical protein
MSGTSSTSRYDLAIVCTYLYGQDALLGIVDEGSNHAQQFTLDCPAFDLIELERQLDSAEGLPLASAKEFLAASTFVSKVVKRMRREGETTWTQAEKHSDAWWEKSRKALQEKRR